MDRYRPSEPPTDQSELTLDELAHATGISVRTIRFYIAQGLLPGAGTRGKSASYGAEHFVRLRLIRLLSERHLPLAETQTLLKGLSLDDARSLLAAEETRVRRLRSTEGRQSPRDYISALLEDARQYRHERAGDTGTMRPLTSEVGAAAEIWERQAKPGAAHPSVGKPEVWSRYELAPGVELHVRADARRAHRSLLGRLLAVAGLGADNRE